ncbi:MAG: hypothetical protein G01um101416_264 [Microgenomates group bacterium Gr01-1014_16]|nr:MAG: hypothetical protein G01um101416_264 [Microgenomates group bacterium Gr01-1014_16]
MNSKNKILIGVFISGLVLIGLWWILDKQKISTEKTEPRQCNLEKITFDLTEIDENGLIGPPDRKVSEDYEFCIPHEDQYLQEIKKINQNIKCHYGSEGRVGCTDAEYLCIGNTGFKDFRNILCKLSTLGYIDRIDRTLWE